MKRLINWFFQGLLFIVPIAVTVWVLGAILIRVDGLLGIDVPGVGLAVTLAGVTLIGLIASTFFAGRLHRLVDGIFQRLPVAKLVYGAVKDLLSAFVGEQRRFDEPVLVELIPGSGIRAIGFVTRRSMEIYRRADLIAVYLPQSYNFAGWTVLVPPSQVQPIEVPSADVLAFVVSGGVSTGASRDFALRNAPSLTEPKR